MIWKILTVIFAVSVAVLIAVLVKIRAQLRDINEQLDFLCEKDTNMLLLTDTNMADIGRLKPCLSYGESSRLLLHGAFCCFPGFRAKHRIFTDQIKKLSKRPLSFFFPNHRGTACNIDRGEKCQAGSSGGTGWIPHEITSISFKM